MGKFNGRKDPSPKVRFHTGPTFIRFWNPARERAVSPPRSARSRLSPQRGKV